jgi:hypothetical protein
MIRKIGFAAALAVVSAGAQAHHSGAMFDSTQTVTLAGTVREFQFTNPHCYIQLVVKNAQGQDEEWSLEMAAPMHLLRLGWHKSSLKPGERINVKIHPLRDGSKGGQVEQASTADGKPIGSPA